MVYCAQPCNFALRLLQAEEAAALVFGRVSVIVVAIVALLGGRPAGQPAPAAVCTFPDTEVAWIQRALDGWEQVSREFLRTDPNPLPWIVLYDAACVWHLNPDSSITGARVVETTLTFAGRMVPVRGIAHTGTFMLPSGGPGEVEMKASTSLYRNGRAAFFTMAMPSVWRTKDVSMPTRAEYLQGVFSHEMTHIRLLPSVNRRVRELANEHDLPLPMNDDVIQTVFEKVDGFESAFNRERDHFFRAAAAHDPARRMELTRRGLDLARQRQARFFTGTNTAYVEVESLFLMLEGVGQWAAYRLSKARAGHEVEAIRLMRDDRRFWSQDEGLALFLLIDALVPDWQARVFAGKPLSPYALLEEAVRTETALKIR
jgi:hypothetical protein